LTLGPISPPTTRFDARLRPGYSVRPELVTWERCIFAVHPSGGGEPIYVPVAGPDAVAFLARVDAGDLDDELRAALARPQRRVLRRWPSRMRITESVGVEQELTVLAPDGSPVDFRRLLPALVVDGVRADPTDPNAHRCAWGGVLTCDGAEAEIATPPMPIEPGVVDSVVSSVVAGREALEALLPGGHRLRGYSTHVSVSQGARGDVRIAHRYARTFAPSMMLVLDRRDSPGLLVRPRPGRLELCGEFAEGDSLRAAITFAIGSALAVAADRGGRSTRPLAVDVRLEAARERFGVYVDRAAFGTDLYAHGRAATLTVGGRRVTAGDHLRTCWERARPFVTERCDSADVAAMDAMAEGSLPLPSEAQPLAC
jgi:hypothetical protein